MKAEKSQGHTQRALERAQDQVQKESEEREGVKANIAREREDRQKAKVEYATMSAQNEAVTKERDELKQRLQVAEAQVRSLTTTLSTSFGASQGSQGSRS